MKRFRSWLTAQLGRRLAFSHFLVIVLTMLVLQLILASLGGGHRAQHSAY